MNKKGGLSIMPKYDLSKSSNIIDVIEQYIDVNVVGDRAICDCPFCKETGPYMIISKQSNSFKCFTCGESGNADDFVKKYESYVMGNDAQLFNSDISKLEQNIQILAKINNDAGKFYHEQLKKNSKAMGYFSERQLNEATIRHFGLGYAPGGKRELFNHLTNLGYNQDDIQRAGLITVTKEGWVYDKFQDRVMFPIINKDGYIIGFGGRVMGEATPQNPKYLNSPATEIFDKSVNLFALNYALKSDRKGMILCEGYMDVIASHQSGFTNAVASLGTAFTSSHARIVAQYTDTVYLSFDNDTAGINAKLRAIPMLRKEGLDVKVIDLTPYKDPDEFIKSLGNNEFINRISGSISSYDYEIKVMLQKVDYDYESDQFVSDVGHKILEASEDEKDIYIKAYNNIINEQKEVAELEKTEIISENNDYGYDIENIETEIVYPDAYSVNATEVTGNDDAVEYMDFTKQENIDVTTEFIGNGSMNRIENFNKDDIEPVEVKIISEEEEMTGLYEEIIIDEDEEISF